MFSLIVTQLFLNIMDIMFQGRLNLNLLSLDNKYLRHYNLQIKYWFN